MAKRIIHEGMLQLSLKLLEAHKKQLALSKELARGVEMRIQTMSEFIRANYTGDKEGIDALKGIVVSGNGSTKLFYSKPQYGGYDPERKRTAQVLELAQTWAQQKEAEDGRTET